MFAFDRVRLGLGMSWRVQVMLFCLLLVCVDHGVMGLRSASGMRNLLDDIPDPDTVLGCGPGGGSTCIVDFKGDNPKKMCNESNHEHCVPCNEGKKPGAAGQCFCNEEQYRVRGDDGECICNSALYRIEQEDGECICNSDLNRKDVDGVCECLDGYYPLKGTSKCVLCDDNVLEYDQVTIDGEDYCVCNGEGHFVLNLDDQTCECNQEKGFYRARKKCRCQAGLTYSEDSCGCV